MNKERLACLDIDGTLVDGVSWLLLTEGLGCSIDEHMNIFNRARTGETTFIEGERLLTKMYRDSGNATETHIRELFGEIELREGAVDLVEQLHEKGYVVYLISGAIDIFVSEVAKKLGADGFYANSSLDFDENGTIEKIHYRDNQGEVKVEQIRELTKKLGIGAKGVVFIGDSENDVEVFEETGKGIAVHSESIKLKEIAWRVVSSLGEISALI